MTHFIDTISAAEYRGMKLKPRKKKSHPESQLQQACVKWFRVKYPQYAKLLFSIPNGGKRSHIEAAIMKAEGVTPGVPDLFLAVAKGGYHGCFIELKWGKGKLTPDQFEITEKLLDNRYRVYVLRTPDSFITYLTMYMGFDNT